MKHKWLKNAPEGIRRVMKKLIRRMKYNGYEYDSGICPMDNRFDYALHLAKIGKLAARDRETNKIGRIIDRMAISRALRKKGGK